jgi:AcrR family transcriptional regulator
MAREAGLRGRAAVEIPQEDGRTRILAAALDVFAAFGFEGASLRQIAEQAGVQHQLVVYHFRTKDGLWRATVASLVDTITARDRVWLRRLAEDGPRAALRGLVREFVQFTARRPEYHRIATFEGRTDNERLRWLLDTYVRPFYDVSTTIIRAAQAAGAARAGDAGQLHYAVIGLVTTSFVFAQEYRLMTGLEPVAPGEVERVTAMAYDFLGVGDA